MSPEGLLVTLASLDAPNLIGGQSGTGVLITVTLIETAIVVLRQQQSPMRGSSRY